MKNRKNFLRFFPVDPPLFSPKKGIKQEKEEEIFLLPPTPISPPKQERGTKRRKKKDKKRKKRNKKKEKRGEKEGLSHPHVLFPFPLKKEKEEETKEKIAKWSFFLPIFPPFRTKENGNGEEENMLFQGHEKEKDLVYQKGKQGLKLCNFISD